MAQSKDVTLDVLRPDQGDRRAGTKMGRRRAMVLIGVHVLIAIHIAHYMASGRTLSPLEPSEATYTLRDGVVNAGAIFLALLVLSTLVLGRFFCGWACHLVALQDAARWILIKLGLRPRPFRSRLLMLIPFFAAWVLFVQPLIERLTDPPPTARAGFVLELTTEEFWATFPGVTIAVITFLVCGFAIVWMLGSKGFCTYGCPYGALFVVSDRVAKGRIRVNEHCEHTGDCTRNCSSNVNVAREVALHGMVVDPGCMKCMDCVAGCPNDALYFGFTSKVEPRKSRREARKRSWDLSWPEEILAAIVFAGAFAALFSLYGIIPLLLAIGLAAMIAAYLLLVTRIFTKKSVTLQHLRFKSEGSIRPLGFGAVVLAVILVVGLAHSGMMRWKRFQMEQVYNEAATARASGEASSDDFDALIDQFDDHHTFLTSWSLITARGHHRMLGERARWVGNFDDAIAAYDAELESAGRHRDVEISKGLALIERGESDLGAPLITGAIESHNTPPFRFERINWELDRIARAATSREAGLPVLQLLREILESAVDRYPTHESLAFELGRGLLSWPDAALRDADLAFSIVTRAATEGPQTHPDLLALAGHLYSGRGDNDTAATLTQKGADAARAQGDTTLADQLDETAQTYRTRK